MQMFENNAAKVKLRCSLDVSRYFELLLQTMDYEDLYAPSMVQTSLTA